MNLNFQTNNIRDYRILWKEDFISYLKESPYYSASKNEDAYEPEDIVVALEKEKKSRQQGEFLWKTMPAELRPNFKRTKKQSEEQKKKRMVDIVEKLKILEQEEATNPGGPKTAGKLDSDGENEENVNTFLKDLRRHLIQIIFRNWRMRSKTKKWMKTLIMVTTTSTMEKHSMKKMTIWMMAQFIRQKVRSFFISLNIY